MSSDTNCLHCGHSSRFSTLSTFCKHILWNGIKKKVFVDLNILFSLPAAVNHLASHYLRQSINKKSQENYFNYRIRWVFQEFLNSEVRFSENFEMINLTRLC